MEETTQGVAAGYSAIVAGVSMKMLKQKTGSFYLTALLGSGRMAEVYLGVNPRTREKRAIKVLTLRTTASDTAYTRFHREIEIMRSLCHPRIIKIVDSGTLLDHHYYGMDYMPGGDLSRRLGGRRVRLHEAIPLMVGVCDAVAYAHERGLVHGDIRPSNVLFDADGLPVISDFGIATVLDGESAALTHSCEMLGTVAYLAPEQRFDSTRVDRKGDVFALGAVLYEMLMSFPPLGNFPWPREIQPGFPAAVEAILQRCLALNPQDRYPHAGALLSDLQEYQCTLGSLSAGEAGPVLSETIQICHPKSDRIDSWFHTLRVGTTRERLAIVREMVEKMEPREAGAILKLFPGEGEHVRWGLIRVLGELQITAATPMLISELKNVFHRECVVEALGRIGSDEAFNPILEYVAENPHTAVTALLPLAQTGKQRAIVYLRDYLTDDLPVVRLAAARALATIKSSEALQALKLLLPLERDERVRAAIAESMHWLGEALRQSESKEKADMEGPAQPYMSDESPFILPVTRA